MWPNWNLAVSFSSPCLLACTKNCVWDMGGGWSTILPPLIVNCLAFLMDHYSLWGHREGVTEGGGDRGREGGREAERDLQHPPPPSPPNPVYRQSSLLHKLAKTTTKTTTTTAAVEANLRKTMQRFSDQSTATTLEIFPRTKINLLNHINRISKTKFTSFTANKTSM